MRIDPALGGEDYCYVRTTGRVTGTSHEVEIWFALRDRTIYILSGDSRRDGRRSDWVKNAIKQPRVTVRIGGRTFEGDARIVEAADEDALARRMLLEKYASTGDSDLGEWGRTALPVAIDLEVSSGGDDE